MEDVGVEGRRKRFWNGKTVLITGHEGFLGSYLAKTLLGYGTRLIGLDKVRNRPFSVLRHLRGGITSIKADVVNLRLIKQLVDKYMPQIIFHLAAEAIVGEANKKPVKTFKSNIEGTWNVLEAARNKRFIKSVVVASSDKAYGEHRHLPYREEAPLKGGHPYDVSKSCADLLAQAYSSTYGMPVCVTRCGNIYGEGDFHFSRLVPDAIRCAIANKVLAIRSDGTFTRDCIYVKDVVDGYLLLAEAMVKRRIRGEAFNFSNETPISVLELVKKIYRAANRKPRYRILNNARNEIRNQYLSAEKARTILGWRPRHKIEEGLKIAVDWYKSIG